VNTQQRSGLNISGVAGTDMFTFAASVVSPAATNVGTAALSLSLTDDKLLVGSDYEVTYNTDTSVTIRRMSDNATVAGSPISLAATPSSTSVTFDGLTLTLPDQGLLNAPDAGHRFLLHPTADAAKDIAVRLFSPSELAVASRVSVTPVTSNIGNASIEYSGLTLVSGALPVTPVPPFQLTYASLGNSFAVTPAASVSPASISYTPGQPLQFTYTSGADSYTYSLTLRGQPANGDKFDLAQTSGTAVKFNSGNAQAILDLRDKTVFDGNTTLSDGYVAVFSSVASTLRESKFSAEFSAAQAASAETQRANKAGVNLDEEAALLIQYQQAYQASAKYMGTVQSLFDTLMSAFR